MPPEGGAPRVRLSPAALSARLNGVSLSGAALRLKAAQNSMYLNGRPDHNCLAAQNETCHKQLGQANARYYHKRSQQGKPCCDRA